MGKSTIREGFEMASAAAGSLGPGEVIECLETRVNERNQLRVHFDRGWVSAVAGSGKLLLAKVSDPAEPAEDEQLSTTMKTPSSWAATAFATETTKPPAVDLLPALSGPSGSVSRSRSTGETPRIHASKAAVSSAAALAKIEKGAGSGAGTRSIDEEQSIEEQLDKWVGHDPPSAIE
jgi:hypothetical protein